MPLDVEKAICFAQTTDFYIFDDPLSSARNEAVISESKHRTNLVQAINPSSGGT